MFKWLTLVAAICSVAAICYYLPDYQRYRLVEMDRAEPPYLLDTRTGDLYRKDGTDWRPESRIDHDEWDAPATYNHPGAGR